MSSGTSGLGGFVPDAIRRRFVVKLAAVVLVAMIVSLGIGGYFYANATDRVESQLSERVTATAQLQADGLRSWIDGLRDQTRTLSEAGEFQRGNEKEIQLFLFEKRRQLSEDIVGVHYITAGTGTVAASTDRAIDGATLGDRNVPWARNLTRVDQVTNDVTNVVVANEPYRSPASGERVIAFVSSPPENTEHAVVVEASLDARADEFHQTSADATTTVRRADGSYVMGDRNASVPEEVLGAARAGLSRSTDEVVGYAPINGTSWTLATTVPAASAYAMRDYVGSSLLATVLATLAVFGVATVAFGRRSARSLEALTTKARAIEDGDLSVDLSTDRVDEVGRLFGAFAAMRDSLREQIETAEDARQRAERARREADEARAEAERLNDRLEARADEYGGVMAACAAGDLTRRLDADADSEAMAQIATAYNEMMDDWEATIREVRAFGAAVGTATDDVTETVDSVRERSAGVRDAAEAMAEDATEQSEKLDAACAELEDLSATVEEVSTAADEVRARADRALDRSEAGREAAAAAADALDDIESSTDRTLAQVESLDDLMADIERVTDLIADVAEQTNMLALNATIEAANAGGDGDGFAVVADEVKALADETKAATGDIEASIDRMREQTAATVDQMRETNRRVSTGTETVADALDAFDDIAAGIEETTDGVREIDRATAEQAESTQEVVGAVDRAAATSGRTAEQAAAVADDAASQSAAVDGVRGDVATLADRAAELDRALRAFQTGAADDDRSPSEGADRGPTDAPDDAPQRVESSEVITVAEAGSSAVDLASDPEAPSADPEAEPDADAGPVPDGGRE